MTFVKEAEGALVPVLLEKYGQDFTAQHVAKVSRAARRDLAASSGTLLDHK
jgi:hypothetical protein